MTDITTEGLERALRSTLEGRASTALPGALRDAVPALGTPTVGARSTNRWPRLSLSQALSGIAGVAAAAALGLVVVLAYNGGGSGVGAGSRAFHWDSGVATLDADALTIIAGGREFQAPSDAGIHSDPGSASYRTLEMGWSDDGTDMRLNIYFGADAQRWWVSEVRSYDGRSPGDWLMYDLPAIGAPRGQSYTGDLDLTGSRGNLEGTLIVQDLRLTAFAPGTGVNLQAGCSPARPPSNEYDGSAEDFLSTLHLELGMDTDQADLTLSRNHICHEYRYLWPMISYSQVWCVPPPGIVDDASPGTDGQAILFVTAPDNSIPPLDFFLPEGCS